MTKAILVVSFGTRFAETRKHTIDAIEQTITEQFPTHRIYRAWTSKIIIRKLKECKELYVDTVPEALERMKNDGITELVVQPTHVLNGIENDLMKQDVLSYQDQFAHIRFGNPLLTSAEDQKSVMQAIVEEFSREYDLQNKKNALVLMGHGAEHYANTAYAAMDYAFKDMGYPNIFVGTVEAYPSVESVLRMVLDYQPQQVVIAPLMIVAGDHAKNDMAGSSPSSWLSLFLARGLNARAVIRGLGEIPAIRQIFVSHIKEALEK